MTTATTALTPFVEGLIDEIFHKLPFSVRIDMILNWATRFATEGYIPDPAIVEIIGTITTLDFRGSRKINEQTFPNLKYLPFTSSLAHLDLSSTHIGTSPICINTLAQPVFQHLVSLNLQYTQLETFDPVLNAPHPFPNLHTLNLSNNQRLSVPTIATTNQFPNLKVLHLSRVQLSSATIQGFSGIPPPTTMNPLPEQTQLSSMLTPSANVAPFQLEKLFLCSSHTSNLLLHDIPSLSSSPHLAQLKEFHLESIPLTKDIVAKLFDPQHSVLKNLTHLCLVLATVKGCPALSVLAQSPLLSNLVSLELSCPSTIMDPLSAEINKQSIKDFINSPFLWTSPQLKHLSLRYLLIYEFVFDDLIPALDAANIKLETLDLGETKSSLKALSAASCLSELKQITGVSLDLDQSDAFETFIQSPLISKLEVFPNGISYRDLNGLSSDQLVAILSSPKMSNDLIELDIQYYGSPIGEVVKTLCTQRVIPGDETSPLKFGKLRKLYLYRTHISDDDVKLIVENLTQLTHLVFCNGLTSNHITDKALTALLATEHNDPCYPYPFLPNLTHLCLQGSHMTDKGWTQFSQSQLLDQLEYLNVGGGSLLKQDRQTLELSPGLKALLTTPLVSNLKDMMICGLLPNRVDDLPKQDESLLKYLDHCCKLYL